MSNTEIDVGGDNNGSIAGRDIIGEQHIHYHGAAPEGLHGGPRNAKGGIHGLYPFNKHFFGRDNELATLHDLLQSEPNVSICPTIGFAKNVCEDGL